jgi:hypothetical protein
MNKLVIILFLLLSTSNFAQQLPTIELDSSRLIENYSSEISDELLQFDEFIQFRYHSSWTRSHTCYVIGFTNGRWKRYTYKVKYRGDHYFTQTKHTTETRRNRVRINDLKSVLAHLDSNQFYTLNLDSLNCSEIKIDDNVSEVLVVTDGTSEVFTVRNSQGIFSIHTYMPEYFQSYLYTDDRRIFIESREKFLSLFD